MYVGNSLYLRSDIIYRQLGRMESMIKIPYMVVVFKNTLKSYELTEFRGAVINSIPPEMTLFHNHLDDGYRFSYPLIQYKNVGGKAAIFCVGEGTKEIGTSQSTSEPSRSNSL